MYTYNLIYMFKLLRILTLYFIYCILVYMYCIYCITLVYFILIIGAVGLKTVHCNQCERWLHLCKLYTMVVCDLTCRLSGEAGGQAWIISQNWALIGCFCPGSHPPPL